MTAPSAGESGDRKADLRGRRIGHAFKLGVVVIGMFGFGYALVPIYDMLCDALGINGRVVLEASAAPAAIDTSRTVTVEFVTTVNGGRPWQFQAARPSVEVHPGQLYTVDFFATNTEGRELVAQAVPNVAPTSAAKYLRKTECFCFNNQPFAAGEQKRMPVVFTLDPELPDYVDRVTLSYTFFDVTDVALKQD